MTAGQDTSSDNSGRAASVRLYSEMQEGFIKTEHSNFMVSGARSSIEGREPADDPLRSTAAKRELTTSSQSFPETGSASWGSRTHAIPQS